MGELFSAETWRQSLSGLADRSVETVVSLLPAIAGALLIMLVGWGVARIVQAAVRRALNRVGFDRFAGRFGLADNLRRANVALAPSAIVARVVFWVLMLTFLLGAIETLGFVVLTAIVGNLVAFLPHLAVAALIVVLGFVLGRAANRLTVSGASMIGLPQAAKLGKAAHAVVLLVAVIVAVEQLGLKTDSLITVLTILVATLSLTMGLAFALGAGTFVTHILAGHYLRQSLVAGARIEFGDRHGVIEAIGAVATVLRRDDRSWLVPNAKLLEDVVGR